MSQKALGEVMTTDLPVFIRDMLANAPHRGGNLNNWIFRAAKTLHKYCSPNEIVELLYTATRGEPLQHNEIERAVRRSTSGEISLHAGAPTPKWPDVDPDLRAKIISE